jgi:translation elongation factor EF-Tu-like GTPase
VNEEIKVFGDREVEGVEVGRRVRLPRGAQPPIRVYVNGVEQKRGVDYDQRGGEILFRRRIIKEGKVSRGRWAAMYLGLFGTYRKHETIDIEYRLNGKTKLLADAQVEGE